MSDQATAAPMPPNMTDAGAFTPHPSDLLIDLVAALLTPMFLGTTRGDPRLARLAALETVHAYQVTNQADLLNVLQIIALGLASAQAACLSLTPDLPIAQVMRLFGHADRLNRSGMARSRFREQERRQSPPASAQRESQREPQREPHREPEGAPEGATASGGRNQSAGAKGGEYATNRHGGKTGRRSGASPVRRPAAAACARAGDHDGPTHRPTHRPTLAAAFAELTALLSPDQTFDPIALPAQVRREATLRAKALNGVARNLLDGMPMQSAPLGIGST